MAILVTGATGGIGTATVQALLDRGHRVYAGVRAGRDLAVRGDVRTVELDVTDPGSVRAAAEMVAREEEAGLRAVVNNAGVIVQGPLELVPAEELHRQFAVNVYGAAEVTRAFLPLLRRGGGRVVNLSAPTARLTVPYLGALSASKAALESLSAAARMELAPWRIPVVIVVPGAMDTQIFSKAEAAAQDALRAADPERVALYEKQLLAVAPALNPRRTSAPGTVAETVVRAVEARRPRLRYMAGRDARLLALMSRLPVRLRDRLLAGALGLNKVPASS